MLRLTVYGAGGHSKEVVDLIHACGDSVVEVVDDAATGSHPTVGIEISAALSDRDRDGCVLAIGDNAARAVVFGRLGAAYVLPTIVHPLASVSPFAKVGRGCQVMQFVVVNASAEVADDCILNVGCSVAHDCIVGAHAHLAPGSRLGGGSSVGEGSLLGTNAVVLPGVHVGAWCTIGAGAVVTRDIADRSVVAGVPARPTSTQGVE